MSFGKLCVLGVLVALALVLAVDGSAPLPARPPLGEFSFAVQLVSLLFRYFRGVCVVLVQLQHSSALVFSCFLARTLYCLLCSLCFFLILWNFKIRVFVPIRARTLQISRHKAWNVAAVRCRAEQRTRTTYIKARETHTSGGNRKKGNHRLEISLHIPLSPKEHIVGDSSVFPER